MSTDDPNTLQEILKAIKGKKLPPVHLWNPDFCGDMDMRIARDGAWYYMGTPIGRLAMVKLFSTVLRHDQDGKYYLVTPVEKLGIKVDDAPFVAVEMVQNGQGREQTLSFRTNVDDWVIADHDHPIRVETDPKTQQPSPYILVRDNLEALIGRAVFYELVDLAQQQDDGAEGADGAVLGVWSAGAFFALGRAE